MRKILIIILVLFFIIGCSEQKANPAKGHKESYTAIKSETPKIPVEIVYKGETSKGTPIIDAEQSSFDIDDVYMMSTPNSSCFSEIGYDSYNCILVVTFRDSGSTYLYFDFYDDDWYDFKSADSLGSYYNSYIKGYYDCSKYN